MEIGLGTCYTEGMNESRKLPIGVQSFEELRTEGYLYVDKTDLIYKLVTEGKQYFLSRPRRFGKSLLTTTFQAYFEGKDELFKGLAIEKLEKKWKKYPVFYLDFAGVGDSYADVEETFDILICEKEGQYNSQNMAGRSLSARFAAVVKAAYKQDGPVVFLVDEYDKPLLGTTGAERERIRALYKTIFGNLKGLGHYFRFAWLTGITKFAKVSVFSDLNQLNVLSMDKAYATLCGITQTELETNFAPEIDVLADEQGLTREACLDKLRTTYDGYRFHPNGERVYNPFSLIYAFNKKEFGAYWFESGTPSSLLNVLKNNVDQLRELPAQDRITVGVSELISSYEDNNNPLTYLYQAGYLTIKSYDARRLEYTIDFPNDEVRYGFLTALIPYVTYKKFTNCRTLKIAKMSDDFEAGDTASFMGCLQGLLSELPYHEGPDAAAKAESVFRNVIASIFLLTGQMVHTEKHTSQGRIDSVVETPEHVYIFEFKVDKTVEEALEQIEQNGYARPYAGDPRILHKIGAVFSTKTRTISDWREVTGR